MSYANWFATFKNNYDLTDNYSMKYLFKGMQSPERFKLLLSLTRISSESVIDALYDHLVKGADKKVACALNQVKEPNFTPALKALEEKAAIVERIKEIDGVS
ncbi:adhesin biosynthesis transcription regulatory family protein [Pseudoalteromonas sp. DL2-H2.2]|uniref:adhesin biosynthesis transcription regulatory family protein n=1 Tax=Pseudoalteromonas sp. DL2-H2.2 TaxID=2908889 RepID=UPI001F38255C|nr:adhesin biosynthesis transcription regulatory family protein [Pseudoalteromonas sp. DL2-H2.2]MCF2909979.1 adhesin biosynthesis transcription regulatory family protein [Pseudoalteromonas sp. DL2-H2.2]